MCICIHAGMCVCKYISRTLSLSLSLYTDKPFTPQCVSPQGKSQRKSLPLLIFLHLIFKVMQANGLDERTNLLVEEYSTSGRLDNITQVMSIHTQYLESFLRSQFYMLRMDGPLPLPYRHYIAIMVRTNRLWVFSCNPDFCI